MARPAPARGTPAGPGLRGGVTAQLRQVLLATGVAPADALDAGLAERVHRISGGRDAATYLVRGPDADVVVKLNDQGLEAEAATLRAWRGLTDAVPQVLGAGTLATAGAPVKYLVLEALLHEGELVETAADYLQRRPAAAPEVGRALGTVLSTMHEARCESGFGNFGDSPGSGRTYASWGAYLSGFLGQHTAYLRRLGAGRARVEQASASIGRAPSVTTGRYLHGDVSIRNIAVVGYHPLRVILFDPNPVSGDPSWDVAPMVNNVELGARLQGTGTGRAQDLERDRGLITGFRESYTRELPEQSLLAGQLVQAVLQAESREDTSADGADEPPVQVARDLVRDLLEAITT